jgi:hypothetical protein
MTSDASPLSNPDFCSFPASRERISQSGIEPSTRRAAPRTRWTLPSMLVYVPSTSAKLAAGNTTSAILPASLGRNMS